MTPHSQVEVGKAKKPDTCFRVLLDMLDKRVEGNFELMAYGLSILLTAFWKALEHFPNRNTRGNTREIGWKDDSTHMMGTVQ